MFKTCNRSTGLLKQTKTSLEDMTQRHRELADSNKEIEAKLFQAKIGMNDLHHAQVRPPSPTPSALPVAPSNCT